MTDRHGPPSAPPLSLAPERFGDAVVLTGIALLLRRERTQTRPAFQRFEAVAVLLLERFRGGFAFSAGHRPDLSRESPYRRIRNQDCVNSDGPVRAPKSWGAVLKRNPRRFSRRRGLGRYASTGSMMFQHPSPRSG